MWSCLNDLWQLEEEDRRGSANFLRLLMEDRLKNPSSRKNRTMSRKGTSALLQLMVLAGYKESADGETLQWNQDNTSTKRMKFVYEALIRKVNETKEFIEKVVTSRDLDVNGNLSLFDLVIYPDGTMKVFDDKAKVKSSASFDINLLTTDDVVEDKESWGITIQREDGPIQFRFQCAKDSQEVMVWISRFISEIESVENDAAITSNGISHPKNELKSYKFCMFLIVENSGSARKDIDRRDSECGDL